MGIFINELLADIESISASINTNELIISARESVDSGLKAFMITPKEKATIKANFEMQFTGGIINKIIDSVLQARISESQVAVSNAEIAIKQKELLIKDKELLIHDKNLLLLAQEIAAKIAQIDVMTREIALKESLNASTILNTTADTAVKTSQKAMIDQQKLTEVQQTAKALYEATWILPLQKDLIAEQVQSENAKQTSMLAEDAVKASQKAMIDQQQLTEVQSTAKALYEYTWILPIQKDLITEQVQTENQKQASMIVEDGLKGAQKGLVVQQELTEVQTTAKVIKEASLLDSNKLLVDAQKLTQDKQRLDVMAGINIKNEQALSTRQSAKFEEARRYVLLKSTKFNSEIQKADKSTTMLNALAVDDAFIISEAHLTDVKADIDAITVADISYVSDLTGTVGSVSAGL